jgi:hypothetical protein
MRESRRSQRFQRRRWAALSRRVMGLRAAWWAMRAQRWVRITPRGRARGDFGWRAIVINTTVFITN